MEALSFNSALVGGVGAREEERAQLELFLIFYSRLCKAVLWSSITGSTQFSRPAHISVLVLADTSDDLLRMWVVACAR